LGNNADRDIAGVLSKQRLAALIGKRLDSNFGKSDEKRYGIPAPTPDPPSFLDA
jgi:hypothetical protein